MIARAWRGTSESETSVARRSWNGWGSHAENLPIPWRAGLPSLNRGRLGLLQFSLWCKDVSTSLTRIAGCLILAQCPLLAWVPHRPRIPAARLVFTLSGSRGAWPLSPYHHPSLKWGRQHAWNKTSRSNLRDLTTYRYLKRPFLEVKKCEGVDFIYHPLKSYLSKNEIQLCPIPPDHGIKSPPHGVTSKTSRLVPSIFQPLLPVHSDPHVWLFVDQK